MKINNPIPQSLPKECEKAARIFKSFVDGGNNGLDGVIPRHILQNARGFAIFTVFKAGFLFSARAGSGIVIAKLNDGTWSAPSAIGTAGVGVGGQAGAEVTDFLVVLNSRAAIRSFMAAGSLSLGGNMSIAIGPLGRNGEASGSVNTSGKVAAMYSYSKTRGLFGGVSLEGSVILERQDANAQAYKSPVTVKILLGGVVEPPTWAGPLIRTLESCTGMPGYRKWVDDIPDPFVDGNYAFGGSANPEHVGGNPSFLKKKRPEKPAFPPTSWGRSKDSGSYFYDGDLEQDSDLGTPPFHTTLDSEHKPNYARHGGLPHNRSLSASASDSGPSRFHKRSLTVSASSNPFTPDNLSIESLYRPPSLATSVFQAKQELSKPLSPHEGVARAIALYNFRAIEPGDLSFSRGEFITITQMSDKTDDWWTGKVGDRNGIFPANFVEVM
ncbi:hypothetical protein AX17_000221 [Amanita inopinata Kibby_2008]|nr:hypothetical protein AX17_000221 [Amanita inopinata Kibby_2008]